MTNWDNWRKCDVCKATTGQACRSLSGAISDGRPDSVVTPLERPHTTRRMRTARIIPDGFTEGLGFRA